MTEHYAAVPTLLGHIAVPIAVRIGCGSARVSNPLLLAGAALSVLPDADVVGFRLGVEYGDVLGHRGFSHSIVFALLSAGVVTLCWRSHRGSRGFVFAFLFLSALSHSILDAFTDGGLGVALLSPFSNERYFAPFQPIAVSPLSLRRVLSVRGIEVFGSEILWLWLPLLAIAATVGWITRWRRAL